jgi:hypothetical protein
MALVVVAALALAALGVWIASALRPPRDGPAAAVERVWSGLDEVAEPPAWPGVGSPADRGRVRGAARTVSRAVRRGSDIVAAGAAAFGSGVGVGVWRTMGAVIRDPVGALTGGGGVVATLLRDPMGVTRAQIEAVAAYVRELRSLPRGEAYRRFMHDLGEAGADVALTRGRQLAARSVLRALRRRMQSLPRGRPPARLGNWHRDAWKL